MADEVRSRLEQRVGELQQLLEATQQTLADEEERNNREHQDLKRKQDDIKVPD